MQIPKKYINSQFYQQLADTQIGKFIFTLPPSTLSQFKSTLTLNQIKNLYICNKNINQIPKLTELKNLQVIWLCLNRITDLTNLKKSIDIKEIYLNNNLVNELMGFQNCSKLLKLNLAYNRIQQIPKQLVLPSSLQTLLLSKNNLVSIQPLSYQKLPLLQTLYLSGNFLTTALTLRRLQCPNLKNVYLDQNNIFDFYRYDQIFVVPQGSVNLINLQYTFDQANTTTMKIGAIKGARARCKASNIKFK